MKEFWAKASTTKKILLVALPVLLVIAALYYWWSSSSVEGAAKEAGAGQTVPELVNSRTGDLLRPDEGVTTATVPPARNAVSVYESTMAALIDQTAIRIANQPSEMKALRLQKDLPMGAYLGLSPQTVIAAKTMIANLLSINAESGKDYVFPSKYERGGQDFYRQLSLVAEGLKTNRNPLNAKIDAWGIAPLFNGAQPSGTKSMDSEVKKYKLQGNNTAELAKLFEGFKTEWDRLNNEVREAAIQKLRTSNPPYKFVEYGD